MADTPVEEPDEDWASRPDGGNAVPGTEMLRLVEVMRTLRGPDGCPWDKEQTHRSLTQYCLEEAYEVVDAIEQGTRADLIEELGDLLLQVVFHAQIGAQDPDPFDIDDVARGICDKLIRRHPFVFPDGAVDPAIVAVAKTPLTPQAQHVNWDRIKTVEKSRTSVLDGIPRAMGAAARAQKVVGRAARAGMDIPTLLPAATSANDNHDGAAGTASGTPGGYGEELLALIARVGEAGLDAETELRAATAALEARIRAAEASGQTEDTPER